MCSENHTDLQALLLPERHRASVVGIVTAQLRFLLSTLLVDMKQDATDRFMRDSKLLCNRTKWFVVLHHAMHDLWPVFSGNTVVRLFWPWSPFANNRRGAGVKCFVVSEQILYFEIQSAIRNKEEVENW